MRTWLSDYVAKVDRTERACSKLKIRRFCFTLIESVIYLCALDCYKKKAPTLLLRTGLNLVL